MMPDIYAGSGPVSFTHTRASISIPNFLAQTPSDLKIKVTAKGAVKEFSIPH
jgi:hypothetical protein